MSERDDDSGDEVLRSLPSRRPQRRSARRDGATAAKRAPAKSRAAKPSAVKAATAKPPAAKRVRPKAAGANGGKLRGVRPSEATSAASSKPGARPATPPEGVELVGTAIQAAGELAQIGLSLGTKALRGAVRRIPRP